MVTAHFIKLQLNYGTVFPCMSKVVELYPYLSLLSRHTYLKLLLMIKFNCWLITFAHMLLFRFNVSVHCNCSYCVFSAQRLWLKALYKHRFIIIIVVPNLTLNKDLYSNNFQQINRILGLNFWISWREKIHKIIIFLMNLWNFTLKITENVLDSQYQVPVEILDMWNLGKSTHVMKSTDCMFSWSYIYWLK